MLEAGAYADPEGVDDCGASAGMASAWLSCVSWAQSQNWDGRWAVALCSDDQVAPIGYPLSSACAAAVLVGRGAPMRVGDAGAYALEQPRLVSWLQMAPLHDEEDPRNE